MRHLVVGYLSMGWYDDCIWGPPGFFYSEQLPNYLHRAVGFKASI